MGQDISTLSNDNVSFNPSEMIAVTRQLSNLLSREIAMLNDMQIAKIHELYEEKMELASILEGYRDVLKNNPEILDSIPKRTLDEMRSEATKFEQLIEEDNKQITRAKEVHKLVMEAVKKTLEKNMVMSSGYNKRGVVDLGYPGTYLTPPVSVNENI
jgi:hypothetical protein